MLYLLNIIKFESEKVLIYIFYLTSFEYIINTQKYAIAIEIFFIDP